MVQPASSPPGKIILINGTSSAGKSTICRALQAQMPDTWCYYASDQLADAGFRDRGKDEALTENMPAERMRFFKGFHRSIPAFAAEGNNLIVEHVIEFDWWVDDLRHLLRGFDVFFVGVHCSRNELERRERKRGDRKAGEAIYHMKTHQFCRYDCEVDSGEGLDNNTASIITAWNGRRSPGALFAN